MSFFKKIDTKEGLTDSAGCYGCGLYKTCKNSMMPVTGNGAQKILIMYGAPSEEDDQFGGRMCDASGQYLEEQLRWLGVDLHEDCWLFSAVNCLPLNKEDEPREPSKNEIECCRHKWKSLVKEFKPEKIILLGSLAVQSFVGDRMKVDKLERWAGRSIPDQTYRTWVYPMYDPKTVLDKYKDKALKKLFEKHLENALEHKEKFRQFNLHVNVLLDDKKVIRLLERIYSELDENSWLSFDYETSGLKPHRKGHYIRTVGFTNKIGEAYAFELTDNQWILDLWKSILNSQARKVAQNIYMEYIWSETILGVVPKRWAFDTMICSHVLDSRSHTTGLKFQSYVRYGVPDYSKTVDKYTTGHPEGEDDKNANSFNLISEAPIKDLLYYCGLDAGITHMLVFDQMKELAEADLDDAYDLFHDGVMAFTRTSQRGVNIDVEYFENKSAELQKRLDKLERKIRKSKEHAAWKKHKGKDLDILSTTQIKELTTKVLKFKIDKRTKNDAESVDKQVLSKLAIKRKFFKLLLEYRKYQKIKSTYIDGIYREAVDGVLHPSINLHIARTFRSSVNSPNLQNIPKRDKVAQEWIRTGFKPRPGNYLVRIDYSGAEIRSGCIYHGDRQMISYQVEGKGDMHKEYAGKLFMLPVSEVDDTIKYEGKNGFIFPQFYGDYWGNNVNQLWPRSKELKLPDGKTIRKHLAKNGIKNRKDYEKHVQEIERQFWEETFPEFNAWKQQAWEEYLETMEIRMKTGFRCTGLQSRKNVVNYPFQGTAFHWLLWTFIQVEDELTEGDWETQLIMQVHDELILDIPPDELTEVMKIVKRIMTKEIRKFWDWINVPLEADAKISDLNGNWFKMNDLEIGD